MMDWSCVCQGERHASDNAAIRMKVSEFVWPAVL